MNGIKNPLKYLHLQKKEAWHRIFLGHFRVPFTILKQILLQNLSYEDEFHLNVHVWTNRAHFLWKVLHQVKGGKINADKHFFLNNQILLLHLFLTNLDDSNLQ